MTKTYTKISRTVRKGTTGEEHTLSSVAVRPGDRRVSGSSLVNKGVPHGPLRRRVPELQIRTGVPPVVLVFTLCADGSRDRRNKTPGPPVQSRQPF